MILVIGLSVTLFTLSSTAWPQPASLSSTRVTPPSVMNTATLPPLNVAALPGVELVRTYRLSFSFTMSMTFGAAGVCAAIDAAPAASRMPNSTLRFMSDPPWKRRLYPNSEASAPSRGSLWPGTVRIDAGQADAGHDQGLWNRNR